MIQIPVKLSQEYNVFIENGCLPDCGQYIRRVHTGEVAALVTDKNVDTLYAAQVKASLEKVGYRVEKTVIEPGEASKRGESYLRLLSFFASKQLTRSDLAVALGGGVVGDLTGFAAATYLRGITYVQLPTTLLAMVDSSVGGKTAIDLDEGKNLAGAFHQPLLVLCDPLALKTLPAQYLSDGAAEIVKYGMIADAELLTLMKNAEVDYSEELLARCICIKRDIVQQDERDLGSRQLLNFGHTVGHAIERLSSYSISHGCAVAMGMAAITVAAERSELCPEGLYWELHDLLQLHGLSAEQPYAPSALYQAAMQDKKRSDGLIHVVIPASRGRCVIRRLSLDEFAQLLQLCEV